MPVNSINTEQKLSELGDKKLSEIIAALEGVFVKPADLEKPDTAEKVLGAKDGQKSVLVKTLGTFLDEVDEATKKVYGQTGHEKIAKDYLAEKYPLVKTTDLEKKEVAEKVLGAKDGQKSVLVETLGTFLDEVDPATKKVYGQTGHEKIAKEFLAAKGMKATPDEVVTQLLASHKKDLTDTLAGNTSLKLAVASDLALQEKVINDLKNDSGFQEKVQIEINTKNAEDLKRVIRAVDS